MMHWTNMKRRLRELIENGSWHRTAYDGGPTTARYCLAHRDNAQATLELVFHLTCKDHVYFVDQVDMTLDLKGGDPTAALTLLQLLSPAPPTELPAPTWPQKLPG